MKKVLAGIITVTCAGFLLSSSMASSNTAVYAGKAEKCVFVQDTGHMPKKDTTKWNKKKNKDSSTRPKKDSTQIH